MILNDLGINLKKQEYSRCELLWIASGNFIVEKFPHLSKDNPGDWGLLRTVNEIPRLNERGISKSLFFN